VSQFFASLLKLMKPLTTSLPASQLTLPAQLGNVTQAHIDPTGHLMLVFEDGCVKLEDLSEEKNRELMMSVVGDVVHKFTNLTSQQKRNLENRIKLPSSITKEVQKSSEVLSAALCTG
jgi:uncharacterized spore protein YtfJ